MLLGIGQLSFLSTYDVLRALKISLHLNRETESQTGWYSYKVAEPSALNTGTAHLVPHHSWVYFKTIICSAKFSAFIATLQVVIQNRALLIKCFK